MPHRFFLRLADAHACLIVWILGGSGRQASVHTWSNRPVVAGGHWLGIRPIVLLGVVNGARSARVIVLSVRSPSWIFDAREITILAYRRWLLRGLRRYGLHLMALSLLQLHMSGQSSTHLFVTDDVRRL